VHLPKAGSERAVGPWRGEDHCDGLENERTLTADALAAFGGAAALTCALFWKEDPGMIGSFLVPIIVPIAAFIGLAAWLGLVFWADAHPGWKAHAAAPGPEVTGAEVPPAVTEAGAPHGSEQAVPLRGRKAA